MKKLITLSLVSALVLSASSLAFATEVETSEKTKPVRTQNEQVMKQSPEKSASIEDKKAEMQTLADEAGLTLEEYIETIRPAREERVEKSASIEDKKAEMQILADEAGHTLEEYIETIKTAREERADKAEMTERADKAEMTERADKAEMTERADKAEMTERADKAEMTERTVKADMTANFKGNSRR